MTRKRRISYRDWLNREPAGTPEEAPRAIAPDAPPPADPVAPPVEEAAARPPVEAPPPAAAAPIREPGPVAEVAPESEPVAEPVAALDVEIEVEVEAEIEAEAEAAESGDEPEAAAEPLSPFAAPTSYEEAEAAHLVFRVGRELFALPLNAVEEAIDVDRVQRVPEMSAAMLGVLSVRGALVPVYAGGAVLGTPAGAQKAALVFTTERGRLALAVDDVDDVLSLPAERLARAPVDFADALLVGVARRGNDLIGVLDATALIAACRADAALETA